MIKQMGKSYANSHNFGLLTTGLLAIITRCVFAKRLVFDQSIQIAKNAWDLFVFDSSGSETATSFLTFLRNLRSLPADQRPTSFFLGILYKTLGVSDLVSLILPFSSSLIIGFLIYLIAKMLFGRATGLVAFFLWALLPAEIFLSSNLLPALPIIAWNLLAVYMLLISEREDSRGALSMSIAVVVIGLAIDWTYSLATGLFLLGWLLLQKGKNNSVRVGKLVVAVLFGLFLFPQTGTSAVDFYYQSTTILENFLVFPMLVMGIVYAAQQNQEGRPRIVLMWLATYAATLAIISLWILRRPIIEAISVSGYWIHLILPAIILIAWQFSCQIRNELLGFRIGSIALLASAFFLYFFLYTPSVESQLLKISRIAVGLAFFSLASYWAAWNSEKIRHSFAFLLFGFLAISTLSIAYNYSESQAYLAVDPEDIYNFLVSEGNTADLFIIEEVIFDRFLYLNKFELSNTLVADKSLRLQRLNPSFLGSVPKGEYVVVSDELIKFKLGSIPDNWQLLLKASWSPQQVLHLYRVNSN